MGGAPDWLLLNFDRVLLLLFDVGVLSAAAAVTTKRLVVARVSGVAILPGAVLGNEGAFRLLRAELLGRAEGQDIWVEGSVLSHDVLERVSSVENLVIKAGVLLTLEVLLALVRIFSVANCVEAREGLRSLAIVKTARPIDEWTEGVVALRLAHVVIVGEF